MKIGVDVTVAPDSPSQPITHESVEVEIGAMSVRSIQRGEYPFKLQVFIEAAVPRMIREAIKEAARG